MKLISFFLLGTLSVGISAEVMMPKDQRIDIWPTIPFIRGADLCKYADAYGKTRSEYLDEMVSRAKDLLQAGADGAEALQLLTEFDSLYDRNQELAARGQSLDVTLESTLKSFLDGYYRDLRPKVKRISFTHVNDLVNVVRAANRGQRDGQLSTALLSRLDYIAYGTYALAPNCRGDIQVNLHLIGRNGVSESFVAEGRPHTVMSKIASQMFELYQRTSFPITVKVGKKQLKLVGGLNGSIDIASSPDLAEEACSTLGARLPNQFEIEILDSYGDWSGGVGLNHEIWAMPHGKVYHPDLRNPTPVRERWEVNAKKFMYYCVR